MRIFHHIGPLFTLLAMAGGAQAGEYAVLTNGFRIHAERHEVEGTRVKLFTDGGMTEFSAEEIASFEQEEAAPVVAAAAPVSERPAAAVVASKAANQDMFSSAAEKHGLPVKLVRSVVKAESNFQPNALSPKGAIGLMQLMPGTAKLLGVDPHVPEQNVEAGTRYLRELLVKYADSEDQVARAIAAYNAGPCGCR